MCVVSLYVYLINTLTARCDLRRASVDQLKSHSVATVCDSSDLEPVKDRMNVGPSSSKVLVSIAAIGALVAASSAWSRDPATCQSTVHAECASQILPRRPASYGRPTRLYIRKKSFCTHFRHYTGTSGPNARPDRGNWPHGSPDEKVP